VLRGLTCHNQPGQDTPVPVFKFRQQICSIFGDAMVKNVSLLANTSQFTKMCHYSLIQVYKNVSVLANSSQFTKMCYCLLIPVSLQKCVTTRYYQSVYKNVSLLANTSLQKCVTACQYQSVYKNVSLLANISQITKMCHYSLISVSLQKCVIAR
jgi:hypothetical protein